MKFDDMKDKITTDRYGFKFIGNNIMIGDNKKPCFTCGLQTPYIEVFSEMYFCSEECVKKFDKYCDDVVHAYMEDN